MAYLDNASTTKPFVEVCDEVYKTLKENYGNPSSLHKLGRNSANEILNSAKVLASEINAKPAEIVFTSGATESINTAIWGTLGKLSKRGKHIITTQIEHSATLNIMHELKLRGYEIEYVIPDENGRISVKEFASRVREDTILASVIMVNNEIGSKIDIKGLCEAFKAKSKCGFFHVDAVQALCKISIDVKELNVDLMSFSAHKIHGPKGVGALYVKEKSNIKPLIYGGGQQSDLRSGTENLAGIVGFKKAIEINQKTYNKQHMIMLCEYLEMLLERYFADDGYVFNGESDTKAIINFAINGVKSEVALRVLESHEVYVSSGSACNKTKLSHVLIAMGIKPEIVDSSIRVSFCMDNTKEDIDMLIRGLTDCVSMFKK